MPTLVRFGCFEVDLASGQLRKNGIRIPLREQSFQILASLLERPGQVVTREDLRRRLWSTDVVVDFDKFAEEAIRALQKAVELSPGSLIFLGWLGHALSVCGRKAEARALLHQLQRCTRYILPTGPGFIHLGLGEIDAAFECCDHAVEERDQIMMPILSYAHFDPIRDDRRFAALVRKMKLA